MYNFSLHKTEWINDSKFKQDYIDAQVEKENKRKNIKIDYEHQKELFNFTSSINWDFIQGIHQKSSSSFEEDKLDISGSRYMFADDLTKSKSLLISTDF